MLEFQTTFNPSRQKAPLKTNDTKKYTILLCGPFAGETETAYATPISVDMDSFESVMQKVSPSRTCNGQKLVFSKPLDFEPLYMASAVKEAGKWMKRLEDVRMGGAKCKAAQDAMNELQQSSAPQSEQKADQPPPTPGSAEEDTSTFESLLSGSTKVSSEPTPRKKSNPIVDKLISSSLESSPSSAPEEFDEILDAIADKLGKILRQVYHDSNYREMETTWLALNDMIGEFDTDDPVQFMLMPYSEADWNNVLADNDSSAAIRSRLAETCPSRPNVIITTTRLSDSPESMAAHRGLQALSELFQCPVVGNIDFETVLAQKPAGSVTKADLVEKPPFQGVTQSATDTCVRLVTPLYRYRLPWGEKWNPCGSFVFEECLPDCLPQGLPWAPGSLLCAYAWASKYRDHEEDTNWKEATQMGGFSPISTDSNDFPATGFVLTENAMAHLYSLGCLPITAMRNSDKILVGA